MGWKVLKKGTITVVNYPQYEKKDSFFSYWIKPFRISLVYLAITVNTE